jgi:hypothetical protein
MILALLMPWAFHLMAAPMVVYPMLGIVSIGIVFFGVSIHYQNSRDNFVRKENEIKRLEKYVDIKNLIQDGKIEEAVEALRQFYFDYIK